jgi:hypothetical protein
VIKRTIRVPPRGTAYGGYQQQQQQGAGFQAGGNLLGAGSYGNIQQAVGSYQQQQQGTGFQAGGNLLGAGSYGNIQQAASSYQQQAGAPYSGGYSGATTSTGVYGSVGGGYGSVGGGYSSVGGGYGSVAGGYGSFGGSQLQQASLCFTVSSDGSTPLPPQGCNPAFCFYL